MSLITPPAALPIRRIQWALRQPHQVNRSGWTGRRQVLTTPGGAMWSCSAELLPLKGQATAKRWIAFFQSLEGQLHKFPVVAVEQDQHGGANPTVASGMAGARTATLSANVSAIDAGDKLTFKLIDGTYQLVTMTAAMSGTSVSFVPALRNTAATGVGSIETIRPFAHVSLVADSFQYSVDQGQMYGLSFDAEESF